MRAFFIILAVTLSLYGCGKCPASQKKDVLAYVNKEAICRPDLDKELALRARIDPSFKITPQTEREQLDSIIDRRLIIQDAMEKGLARQPRFVNTIRRFWEQTLIRDFVEYKQQEFQDYLFVTDDEVKEYYENLLKSAQGEGAEIPSLDQLRPEIERRIMASKERRLFEDWLKDKRKKSHIKIYGGKEGL